MTRADHERFKLRRPRPRRGTAAQPPDDADFPPEDNEYEARRMRSAGLRVIPGVWGSLAGGAVVQEDTHVIDAALRDLPAG